MKSSRLKPLPQELGGDCAGRGYAPDAAHSEHAGRVQSQDHAGATGHDTDCAADPAVDAFAPAPAGSGGLVEPGFQRMAPAHGALLDPEGLVHDHRHASDPGLYQSDARRGRKEGVSTEATLW